MALAATGLTRQLLTFARGGEPVKGSIDTEQLLREVVSFTLHGSHCRGVSTSPPGCGPSTPMPARFTRPSTT